MPDSEFTEIVQARFEVVLPDGHVFRDALVMPRGEYEALTLAQRRTLREQRVANYLKNLKDAQNAPRPTRAAIRAERRARREALREQIAQVEAEIASESPTTD